MMPPTGCRTVPGFLTAMALALFASAPPVLAGQVAQGAAGVATSVDPIALQEQIAANRDFNISSLWQSLKIPAQLDTVYSKVGAPPPDTAKATFDRCANACLAEISRANVDDDPIAEVILTIYQEGTRCRFLVFRSNITPAGVAQWRFLGYADHDTLGQYEPEYHVSFMGGHRYFVVSAPTTPAITSRGAGAWLRYERWFEVSPAGMREVLSLPTDGFECADARALCRSFASTVVGARNSARGAELQVAFTVRYWGDYFLLDESRSGEIALFGRNQRAAYVRPLKSTSNTSSASSPSSTAAYTLAPLDSEIASWEVDAIFRLDALTCQDFLVANADNLQQIASTRAVESTAWLTRYVSSCPASTQRTQLLELLK